MEWILVSTMYAGVNRAVWFSGLCVECLIRCFSGCLTLRLFAVVLGRKAKEKEIKEEPLATFIKKENRK